MGDDMVDPLAFVRLRERTGLVPWHFAVWCSEEVRESATLISFFCPSTDASLRDDGLGGDAVESADRCPWRRSVRFEDRFDVDSDFFGLSRWLHSRFFVMLIRECGIGDRTPPLSPPPPAGSRRCLPESSTVASCSPDRVGMGKEVPNAFLRTIGRKGTVLMELVR